MALDAMLAEVKKLIPADNLPELGPGPRGKVPSQSELSKSLDSIWKITSLPKISKDLVCGIVLLWHDHLDAAHEIAQSIENPDGSFLHGIIHRREPDYGNASYWFRRVGDHPAFPMLAERAVEYFKGSGGPDWKARLIQCGRWDPFAFIDLCQKESGSAPDGGSIRLLCELQALESNVLLENWIGS